MTGSAGRQFLLAAVSAVALAACQQTGDGGTTATPAAGGATAGAPVAQATSVKLVDRDVEAPEIFQTTDMALWDGRPSLGGVWVASPEAKDPERVILRNTANGKFVIGALFRSERENPGPTLQISSDAAAALGLLAGQPGRVSVTALRREEAPAAPDARKPLLDAAETTEAEALAPAAPAPGVAAPAKPPAAGVKAPAVAQPAKPGALPAQPAPGGARPDPAAKPGAAKAPAPAPAPLATGSNLLQIGIFSVEANARRAADTLTAAGIAARIAQGQTQGKTHWSVTASGNDRAALLAKVKSLGFSDAYFLSK